MIQWVHKLTRRRSVTVARSIPEYLKCRLCGRELQRHERPERVCDECLRANQTRPYNEREEIAA